MQKLQKVMVTMGSEPNEINNFSPILLYFVGFILKPLKLPLGVHDSIKSVSYTHLTLPTKLEV